MGVIEFGFDLEALKAKITGIFNGLYCCYGSQSGQENNHNLLTNSEALLGTFTGAANDEGW